MADHIYDLIIIGAGPAGYTAALRAAAMGMDAVLIEKKRWAAHASIPLYSCQGASAGDGSLPGYVKAFRFASWRRRTALTGGRCRFIKMSPWNHSAQ